MQAEGYRVIRLTHRRLEREPQQIAAEIKSLLAPTRDPAVSSSRYGCSTTGGSGEEGQGTVEWVGLVAVVALLLVGLVAAGVRVPAAELARAVGSKLLCAAALAENCGDEPALVAAYGSEIGELAREHMPSIAFEHGSRALPVDFRRCRDSTCGDGSARGLVERTDEGLPVTAFVHVIDCRGKARASRAADCSADRAGNLYIQYWLYYADSATLRGVPIAGPAGYHRDDWESVQVRIGPDGDVEERASSHHGYNHSRSLANAGADAGIDTLRGIAETVGARPRNGWGPQRAMLRVSGGSHAGNASGYFEFDRVAPAGHVHLVPLEPIASAAGGHRFAVSPPWEKHVWQDPEAVATD